MILLSKARFCDFSNRGYGNRFFWDWLVKIHDNSFQTPHSVSVEDFFEVRLQLIMLWTHFQTSCLVRFLKNWLKGKAFSLVAKNKIDILKKVLLELYIIDILSYSYFLKWLAKNARNKFVARLLGVAAYALSALAILQL